MRNDVSTALTVFRRAAPACLVILFACASPAAAQTPTYSKDVAPLLVDRCGVCHHAGGSAPFSLLTYADAKQRATQVAAVTRSRLMPPWKADPSNGPFVDQHPLSDAEIAMLGRWVKQGSPEGDPRELPAPRTWTEGWQLGKPDLVITLPDAYTLPAEGTDVFRIFTLPIPTATARFVRGLQLGNQPAKVRERRPRRGKIFVTFQSGRNSISGRDQF